jgi:UDP-glucose 4-epimerase
VVEAALAEKLPHSSYNIASGIGQTLRQFADAVKANLPDAVIEIGAGGNAMGFDEHRAAIFDVSRAKAELGFECRYGLKDGVADYIAKLRMMQTRA